VKPLKSSHDRTESPPNGSLHAARSDRNPGGDSRSLDPSSFLQAGLFNREIALTRIIYCIAICVALGLLVFAIRADWVSTQRAQATTRAHVQNELAAIRSRLESNLTGNIQMIRGLPGLFALDPNLTQQEFERAVEPLLQGRSLIRNIAAAPDMVITLMHPIWGNEQAIGLDYRKIPAQFEAADRSRRLRRLVLAGPVDLVQGGKAFISRIPIFQNTADGEERFWGIVSTVLDAQQLYLESGLLDPDGPVEIAIRGKDGLGADGEHFFGRPEIFENAPVLAEIQLPQGTWLLGAIPNGGWEGQPDGIWLQRGTFFLAAAMTIVPLLMLARTRDQLMKVAQRRQEAEELRQKIEQQMLHSQKFESLGVMAGGIAHDFNNILTAIMGYTQLLANSPWLSSESAGYLRNIDGAAVRAAELCNRLLAYSGKGLFAIEPVDLSELICETEELLRVSVPKKTEVQLKLKNDNPMIEADASQLRQVVMNLITNAIDAIGDEQGTVTIETGFEPITQAALQKNLAGNECLSRKYVFVKVTDTGCGMGDSTLAKVFDPFYTTKSSGHGLGMAAVLGVVRSHRGAIFCDSKIGQGSTFTVAFPPTDKLREPTTETRANPPVNRQATILVIDDEPAVRSVVEAALTALGHTVIAAEDGQQGVELFEQHCDEISLCIVDMAMPRMGGMETLRAMRSLQPNVRVILISGYSEEDLDTATGQQQPNSFIKKPFRIAEFTRIVNEVLG